MRVVIVAGHGVLHHAVVIQHTHSFAHDRWLSAAARLQHVSGIQQVNALGRQLEPGGVYWRTIVDIRIDEQFPRVPSSGTLTAVETVSSKFFSLPAAICRHSFILAPWNHAQTFLHHGLQFPIPKFHEVLMASIKKGAAQPRVQGSAFASSYQSSSYHLRDERLNV